MSTDGRAVKPPSGGRSVDCEKIREHLFDYLSHELGGGPSSLLREHLRRCPACAAEAHRIQQALDTLRSHDPGESAAPGLDPRRRRRMLWLMGHPFIALCVRHHTATAIVVAAIVLAVAVTVAARILRIAILPKALPPVELILQSGQSQPQPPLDDVPPVRELGDPPTLAPDTLGTP